MKEDLKKEVCEKILNDIGLLTPFCRFAQKSTIFELVEEYLKEYSFEDHETEKGNLTDECIKIAISTTKLFRLGGLSVDFTLIRIREVIELALYHLKND